MRRDQKLVEHFLSTYNHAHSSSYKVIQRPEEANRRTKAVEALATNEQGTTMALEHTLIEPFDGEREDTTRFIRVFGPLEGSTDLRKPGYDVDVIVNVGAVATGFDWEKAGELLHRHLASRIPVLEEGRTREEVIGTGFRLEVTLAIFPHEATLQDHVWISRTMPGDSLETVVRRALEHKLPKLMAERADVRVLLFEKADIAIGVTNIKTVVDRLLVDFPQLSEVDEVWLVITHSWESQDVLFFYELWPELGRRRWMMEKTSLRPATIKVLGAV
jgi:hypothetical protein